ncbi:NAC domain-containing protein 22-like [Bidens hawaiensis]|uniref:NAC domain-containing protein 22-like n=1 Tax=Bidens hawaiensis TaxID=980011 RepID=UPI00404A4B89
MCSSSCIPHPAKNEYWTNEAIFMSLISIKRGKPLPRNVTSDVNPYQYKPSNLPADLWYLWSGVTYEAECGFWQETEAPHEMFSNSRIIGSMTTLQFYEGRAPHSQKTDWLMQQYRTTEKQDGNTKDLRALCRVFLANTDVKISINLAPKMSSETEMHCILNGDYFELNNLNDPGSRSSSSVNSSCLTMTSDEYIDSIALLQEIENDIKDSSVKFSLSAPLKPTEVFILPATSVPLITDQDSKCSAQETFRDCKSLSISIDLRRERWRRVLSGPKGVK